MFSNLKSDRDRNLEKTEREDFFASKPSPKVTQTQKSPVQRQLTSRTGRTFSATEVLSGDGSTEVIQSQPIQTKLAIGEVGDKYEREADRVAKETVQQLRQPLQKDKDAPPVQQRPISPYKLQRREELQGGEVPTELETQIDRAKSGGQSLAPDLQGKMGRAMGTDFSHVKVHTDSHSDRLNQSLQARAFTTGNHVFFKKGEYSPNSTRGQELLAHELTHVVQQNGGAVQRKIEDGGIVQRFWGSDKSPEEQEKQEKERKIKTKQKVITQLFKSSVLQNKQGNLNNINLGDVLGTTNGTLKSEIKDRYIFDLFIYFCEDQFATENPNAILLLNKTKETSTRQLMAAAETLCIEIKDSKYSGHLALSNYKFGGVPEDINLAYEYNKNLKTAYTEADDAYTQGDRDLKNQKKVQLISALMNARKGAFINMTDSWMRFRRWEKENNELKEALLAYRDFWFGN
ncbi:MAG: DUF4157 domain-containing protein [Cyanobacteria bacterium SBLK]|nr:DUF4157 domain-containing protein [Cyanobacteria bacterium SBLK]